MVSNSVRRAREGGDHETPAPSGLEPPGRNGRTVGQALLSIVRDPYDHLIRRWNWKSALTSSLLRAPIFFFVNLTAGRKAAAAAFLTELVLRGATSGFYGSLIEAIGEAEPEWLAGLTAAILLPAAAHSLELLVHWLRGTPKLAHSVMASLCFTGLSTLFNFYVMRRGAYIVGENRKSLLQDLRSTPRLLLGFTAAGPLAVIRWIKRRNARDLPPAAAPGWGNEAG